jgi:hypothetical protein
MWTVNGRDEEDEPQDGDRGGQGAEHGGHHAAPRGRAQRRSGHVHRDCSHSQARTCRQSNLQGDGQIAPSYVTRLQIIGLSVVFTCHTLLLLLMWVC